MPTLQELRLKKNLTQTQVARALNIADGTVSLWERGLARPEIETGGELAKLLDVTADELIAALPPRRQRRRKTKPVR
ncbi:MAG: helix-turn-helix domain-containing protein [Actinomycetota bacterium]